MAEVAPFLSFLFLLGLGYLVGRVREARHISSLTVREQEFADMAVTNLKRITSPDSVSNVALVTGDAVIATDYFKSFAAGLRNIVGGKMGAYETLMIRARREATLRMLESARSIGATEVWNVRLETSNIRSATPRQKAASVEVFAFGTAVVRG